MADSTTNLETIASGQAQKEVTANQLFDALSPGGVYGRHAETCAGLTWGYYGGRVGGTSVANGTVSLSASGVNYVVAAVATGAVSASNSATNWFDIANYRRLYKITAGATTVSSYQDFRFGRFGVFARDIGAATPLERVEIPIRCYSDITSAISTATTAGYHRPTSTLYITEVRASLSTVSSSGAVTVNVLVDGVTILSSAKLTIDQSEKTSTTAATGHTFASGSQSAAADSEITIDIDGAGTGAKGLVVTVIGYRGIVDPYAEAVSLLAHCDGANNSTTITDSSTFARTATVYDGAKISTAQSKFGGASMVLDGTNDYVDWADAEELRFGTGDFTVEFWVRLTALPATASGSGLIGKRSNSGNTANAWCILLPTSGSGALAFQEITASGSTNNAFGGTLSTATWYHIAVSRSGSTVRGYVDGVQQLSYSTTANFDGTGETLKVGRNGSGYLNGYMEEIRITKGVARYTAAFTVQSRAYAVS